MARSTVTDHATHGSVILERLANLKLAPAVKSAAADFKKTHGAYVTAAKSTDAAKTTRDAAVRAVSAADEALGKGVEVLAAKMAGAQMGARKNPFAGFSKHAPYNLTNLAYADEVKEVTALVAKVQKSKPPVDVAKAAVNCTKLAAAVTKALDALTKPQLAYTKALNARDGLLLTWTKSLTVLKKNAQVAWLDEPATYKSVFAAPAKVQAPVKKRAKKSAAAATPGQAAPAKATPARGKKGKAKAGAKKVAAPMPTSPETNGVSAGTVVKPLPTSETSGTGS